MTVHVRDLNNKSTNVRINKVKRFAIRTLLNITRHVSPAKAVANAELVLDATVDLTLNLRRQLLLANLFAALA